MQKNAFYGWNLPRIVVHFICREALFQYLVNHLRGSNWRTRLRKIMDLDPTDGLTEDELGRLLTPQEGATLRDILRDLKCCDPAVGSGAFPVGLMHELVNLRRVVEAAANGYVDPAGARGSGAAWVHKTKEEHTGSRAGRGDRIRWQGCNAVQEG